MYLYNITYHIQQEIAGQWMDWLRNEHLDKLLKQNFIHKAQLIKVKNPEESAGQSFAVHYHVNSKSDLIYLQKYLHQNMPVQLKKKFGEQVLFFATELEIVEEFNQ